MSASSLLDMNALPSWMQEQGQAQTGPTAQPPAQSWGNSQQPVAPASSPPDGLSGSSLIDPNIVPDWLRPSAQPGMPVQAPQQQGNPYYNQPVQYGQTMQQGPMPGTPVSYSMPPRTENIRVPSRPRNEINPQQESAEAANVFASMLGVASNAPQFPPQAPGSTQMFNPSAPPATAQNMHTMQPPQGYSPGQSGIFTQPGQGGYPSAMPSPQPLMSAQGPMSMSGSPIPGGASGPGEQK
jgi:hypothetical protein